MSDLGPGSASDVGGHQHTALEQPLGREPAARDGEDGDRNRDEGSARGGPDMRPDATATTRVPLAPGMTLLHHQLGLS